MGNVTAILDHEWGASVGGLIGFNQGEVTDSFATGNVAGDLFVGGLIGSNTSGTSAKDGTVTNVYAAGSVTGDANSSSIGGLIGYENGNGVTNAYALGAVTGNQSVGGLIGQLEDLADQRLFHRPGYRDRRWSTIYRRSHW